MDDSRIRPIRFLVTAGPTHEPIDAVRAIVNRSSGKAGAAIADAADERGMNVTMLAGPGCAPPLRPTVPVESFTTTADLQRLLQRHFADCDILVQAAAVADYRPEHAATARSQDSMAPPADKVPRGTEPLTLTLAPTPDLVAACAARRRPGQTIVAFALEPATTMIERARAKLLRKGVDLIVANPLQTMEAGDIEATLLGPPGSAHEHGTPTPGRLSKRDFGRWLVGLIEREHARRAAAPRCWA